MNPNEHGSDVIFVIRVVLLQCNVAMRNVRSHTMSPAGHRHWNVYRNSQRFAQSFTAIRIPRKNHQLKYGLLHLSIPCHASSFQALRLYQQSLEKQKRIKKRIDEERAPFSSSPSNLSSWFLRSLVSSYNISATSLDVLFPHSMCPLLCPTQRINPCKEVSSPQNGPQTRTAEDVVSGPTGFVKSRNRAMRKNSFASLSANVLSPSVLSRCPNGVLDILGSSRSGNDSPTAHTDEAFNDDCSDLNSEVNFLTAIRVSGASHGILDSSLWESSGLFCGSLTEGFSSQTTVSHSNGIQEHTTQLSAEEAEVGGSYQVYQGKVGSLGVQSMTDMAIRLFLYLKGFPPGSTDLKKLSDVVFSTAKSWDLCGLQWVINSSIVLSHEVPSGWKPSSKNLTKALISSANVEEVFDHWICCACGKEVQLWSAYGQSPKDFLEGVCCIDVMLLCSTEFVLVDIRIA